MLHRSLTPVAVLACLGAAPLAANEFAGPLTALAQSELNALATAPTIIEAVRAQNAKHAGLTPAEIEAMDREWRAQVGTASGPMIDGVLASAASAWLRERSDQTAGLITEVFVTDNHGLNVAQSTVTSDYWQGDEAKWTETFGKPDGTVHLGEVELDESTQTYQSQVSLPINDPDSGEPLGAITIGVNLELLQ
jgi:hypothetical protein